MRWLVPGAVLVLVSLSAGQRSVETVDLAGSRYFISQTSPYVPSLNWFLAYQYCRTIGMELLSIGTAEEAELINSYLAANRLSDRDYWTSGNQLGSHLWMWMATGQRFNTTFNFWVHDESFTKSTAACMSVNNGAWVPEDCMQEKFFICELTRCFFVNFVSANRGSSQGLPVTPRITHQGIKPSHRSGSQQQQSQAAQKTEQPKTTDSPTQPGAHQPTTPSQQHVITTSSTTTVIPTTYEDDTRPTTQMPLKTMPTILPDDQLEEVTIIPQSRPDEVKSIVQLNSEPAAHNNEILESGPISPLQLLIPPTREFLSSSPSSSSSIPLQAEASTNFTIRRPLSRKETFSWALLDERSK
ncbi:uncharacterized protein LOC123517493 isoform X2 [Portunus trituberculatus]|uniref:uncharacterized protein LOC123517493 isoform X2 n=1 Tax=Portunus trituberculatus TaxID=210409 RepID=UPI001E1CF17D|nr:uncharacterized protein LOC123517493 isoform X2 [Portunus trituberculatus]